MPKELFGCEICKDVFKTLDEAVECEGKHIRRCANPVCDNKFIVIDYKGFKKMYCCHECQNAAKQRRHRERRKAI